MRHRPNEIAKRGGVPRTIADIVLDDLYARAVEAQQRALATPSVWQRPVLDTVRGMSA